MTKTAGKLSQEEKEKLLELLTYEKVRGKPIYYRGYEKVLKGELPPEAVMGSSGLQAFLIRLIVEFLLKSLDLRKYEVLFNEVGFTYGKGSRRSLDVAVFEKEKVKPYLLKDSLIPVPPTVVVEVDTKADLSRYGSFEDYAFEKTQDLLDAGVERVIWLLTKPKKVMVAKRGEKWVVQNWDEDFEVFENVKINLNEILKKYSEEVRDVQ